MKYTYVGENKNGQRIEKTVEADDQYAVYDIARQEGNTVVSVNEARSWSWRSFFNVQKIEYYMSRVSDDSLTIVTRNLGSMLTAGLPLSRALSVMERQSTNPKLKGVLKTISERVGAGDQFHSALAEFPHIFSDLYVAMVRAGEESGSLAQALTTLSVQMERSSNLKKKIRSAMIYPAIVITIMVGIGILMMIYVMPTITSTFRNLGVDLPITTRILIIISDAMVAHTFLVLGGLVALVVGLFYSLRTYLGRRAFHFVLLHLPLIGNMTKETNAARTARTLASLLHSQVDVIRSLNITEEVIQNSYYKPIIKEAAKRVEKGTPLSSTFIEHHKLYPVLVGEMILVGEETGQISEMLEQLAVFYEAEIEQKTKNLSTIIEPLLMVVIGVTVGFFALAMIAPIYSIGDSL